MFASKVVPTDCSNMEEENIGFNTDEENIPKFIDYEESNKQFSLFMLTLSDSFVEISNEGSDIYFAVDELRRTDSSLFYASMVFP